MGGKLKIAEIQVDRSLEKLFAASNPLEPTAKDVNYQGKDQGLAELSYEKKLDQIGF